ncbi:MAG TPA: FG-GAP-like repeat-containing protein, partial [Bryobacteraceae bacterium]|nr:FG-GAP-like repeat-containing protein [Bryobacteraceae bacterium]
AGMVELGLTALDAGAKTMRSGLDALTGPPARRSDPHSPPVHGPQDLDTALADFVNQMVRIGWVALPEGVPLKQLAGDLLNSARRAFGFLDFKDPRTLALPLELPVSATGIAAETFLRMVAIYSAVGPKRLPAFLNDAAEVFVETAVFVGLEYKEIIARYREHLNEKPHDTRTRLELGRMYVKCGLYDDAVRELSIAAEDPAMRARAKHESALAHFRAGRFAEAVDDGVAAMAADPGHERARAAMWLASRSLGGYPAHVPEAFRMELKAGYEPARVRFENIAAKIGLDKISAGRGTAIFDYNNDGLLDIVVTAAHAGCTLYRNNGDGTFTDVTVGSGLDQCINGFVIIAGDYDNDGFQDLFVTRLGFYYGECSLYHNNGDGTFTDVTEKAGVQSWGPSYTASWVDYDCDGWLDLFIGYNLGGMFDRRCQNRLFHNNGDGTFTDVTEQSRLANVYTTIGSCWGDYNDDGYPDLFLSSGIGRPQLFRNNGNGTFTDVSAAAGLTHYVVGTTCGFIDYNNDGLLDIVQYSWSDHEDVIHTMKTGHGPEDGAPLVIYHNNGDGTFTPKTRELGLDGCWGTMSGSFGDVNNDGYIDLLLGNGSPRMERLEPFVLLENSGGSFRNTTFSAGLPFYGKSHGTNCGDLFGDGRMSILIAAGGAYPGDLLQTAVHCPRERPGNYLNVRLRGVTSNRDGNGARITLFSGKMRQVREVTNGSSFGCPPLEQHFGLGEAAAVDAIEIRWPGGHVQRVEDPPVNDTICITEGQADWERVYPARNGAALGDSGA